MDRRSFFARSTLALGGLLVGDAALEAFERLTHRKVFALGHPPTTVAYSVDKVADRSMWTIDATVSGGMLPDPVTYRQFATNAYAESFAPDLRRAQLLNQFRYQMAKQAQRIAREYGIPLTAQIPAMERALA